MLHLDLFSGIGGFAYAADQVWDDVEHIFCDNEPFAQQVIKKHWPESEIYDDIRTITDSDWRGCGRREPQKRGKRKTRHQRPFLLTGGFPCQPFSQAGLRRGASDDRFLWPEMLRVIRLTQPQWVIAENVRGLLTLEQGVVFQQVCADLEAEGYEVQPFIIPAVAVNAPHRRDRIWFIAHSLNSGQGRKKRQGAGAQKTIPPKHRPQDGTTRKSKRTDSNRQTIQSHTDTERKRPQLRQEENPKGHSELYSGGGSDQRPDWSKNWLEVATEFCSVDDGLSVELDGFKLSKSQHRKEQLKAYGNAIVPQVAIEIMQAIKFNTQKGLTHD